jgi:signal transduction histidine kinase
MPRGRRFATVANMTCEEFPIRRKALVDWNRLGEEGATFKEGSQPGDGGNVISLSSILTASPQIRDQSAVKEPARRTGADPVEKRPLSIELGVSAFVVSLAVLASFTVGMALLLPAHIIDPRIELALSSVVAALVVGLAVSTLAHVRLRPLGLLTARARELAALGRPERLGVTADDDELSQLATSLDQMLDEIRKATDSERMSVEDASHELRTPIAIARAELDLALRNGVEGDIESALRSAIEELDRAVGTATDLLVEAQTGAGAAESLRDVSVQALATRAADVVRLRSPRADVRMSVTGSGQVSGDAAALERCLVNLIGNAAEHCSTSVEVNLVSADDLVVTIDDDGPGVPEALLPHFFERFAHANNGREDSFGLGTAIAAEIVHAHGGTIAVANRDRGGAEITIRLPTTSEAC